MKDKIKFLLQSERLTTTRFAEMLGIQPSAVSHLVSGRNKPGYDLIKKILRQFPQIDPDWFLLDKETPYRTKYVGLSEIDAVDGDLFNPPRIESIPSDGYSAVNTTLSTADDFGAVTAIAGVNADGHAIAGVNADGASGIAAVVDQPTDAAQSIASHEAVANDTYGKSAFFADKQAPSEAINNATNPNVTPTPGVAQSPLSSVVLRGATPLRVVLFYDDGTCESFSMR